ncbi:MAG: hypothetical protein C0597_04285 [Marinilabiliales bacterium]|nr:MAG: hypothetical protein C0597_04285 [Marinilabiliales bacterium]
MYQSNSLLMALVIILTLASCNIKQNEPVLVNLGEENNYLAIADTIITDVVIQNPDENEWTDYTLRNLNKEALVNEIFSSVYDGKLTPYEFFKNEPLTIEDVKNLEDDPEFDRDQIGKVQFEEAWYYDAENHKMVKKVHSIMLAYEIYNPLGEIKGYKPAFKVYFKTED